MMHLLPLAFALILLASGSATALPLSFDLAIGGDTDVFSDPFGHDYDSELESSSYEFQMALGSSLTDDDALPQEYMGDMSATDFHLDFNLPFADPQPDEFNELYFLQYGSADEEIPWSVMISDDNTEIWFLAPDGVQLDAGELFETEVEGLSFASTDGLTVRATWTATQASPVPEPSAALVFGVGLLVAGATARRRH